MHVPPPAPSRFAGYNDSADFDARNWCNRALVCGFVVSLPTDSKTSITAWSNQMYFCGFIAALRRLVRAASLRPIIDFPSRFSISPLQMGADFAFAFALSSHETASQLNFLVSTTYSRTTTTTLASLRKFAKYALRSWVERKMGWRMGVAGTTVEFYRTVLVDDQTICIIGRLHNGSSRSRVNKFNRLLNNLYTLLVGENNSYIFVIIQIMIQCDKYVSIV